MTVTWDEPVPCRRDPEAWFGYDGESPNGRRGPRSPLQQQAVDRAKWLCVNACPAGERRQCARQALERGEQTGIWAGVEFPSQKLIAAERRGHVALAREQLRAIAEN